MAKSFHLTIDEWDNFEVEHWGNKVYLELPKMFQEIVGKTEDEEVLLEWIQKHKIVLPVIQCAIQKRLIDLRAIVRPPVKKFKSEAEWEKAWREIERNGDGEDYEKNKKELAITKIIYKDKECQERMDKAVWKAIPRPGQKGKDAAIKAKLETLIVSIESMLDMGLDKEMVKEKMSEKFPPAIVAQAINVIESKND